MTDAQPSPDQVVRKPHYALFSAIVWAMGGALFIIFTFMIENEIGSPSSTSGIIMMFVPPFAVIGGAVGASVGLFYAAIVKWTKIRFLKISDITFAAISALVVFPASFAYPLMKQLEINERNRPQVLIDKQVLSTELMTTARNQVQEFKASKDPEKPRTQVFVHDSKYEISYESHSLTIKYLQSGTEKQYDFQGYDYIRDVKFKTLFDEDNKEEYLLVYMQLRSTSGNVIFSIFNQSGECVYQKLEKRRS